jgi:hypothetical protein
MILNHTANRHSFSSAPILSALMVLALLASMGLAPVLVLAGVCAKPCCSDLTQLVAGVVNDVEDCCESDAPRAPHGHSNHGDEPAPSSDCSLEWCCDAGPQGVPLQFLPTSPICAPLCDGADAVCRAMVTLRESAEGWHTHGREAGWPPSTRRHLLNCLLLI